MSPTNEQIKKDSDLQPSHDEGDVYDEDTGEFLGNLQLTDQTLPAQLAFYHQGFWYIFKPDSRYKHEDAPDPDIREELSGVQLAERAGTLTDSQAAPREENSPDSPLKKHFSNPDKDISLP